MTEATEGFLMNESRRVCGFHSFKDSWYFDSLKDSRPDIEWNEFTVGIYWIEPDNGCEAEFTIILFESPKIGPQLKVYSDAGPCFEEEPFKRLWKDHLANELPHNPDDFKRYLLDNGFEDLTNREDPGRPFSPKVVIPKFARLEKRLRGSIGEVDFYIDNDDVGEGDVKKVLNYLREKLV